MRDICARENEREPMSLQEEGAANRRLEFGGSRSAARTGRIREKKLGRDILRNKILDLFVAQGAPEVWNSQ